MDPTPRHVGFIMDGNRRFAKRLMLEPTKGHDWGAKKLRTVLKCCKKEGIKEITLFAFSTENFNRPKAEFDYLMRLFKKELLNLIKDKETMEEGIMFKFIGRTWMFDSELQKLMAQAAEKTSKNKNFIVNFALAYGGRAEIVDATKRIAEAVKQGLLNITEIDEKKIMEYLYLNSEPDMVIRTGGDKRTSNFLTYQSVYSEWFFLDKFWPEIEEEDIKRCVGEFKQRERRFGK